MWWNLGNGIEDDIDWKMGRGDRKMRLGGGNNDKHKPEWPNWRKRTRSKGCWWRV